MSNDSTNKVDPVIKCFFVSFCTVMAVAFISSFSIKFGTVANIRGLFL